MKKQLLFYFIMSLSFFSNAQTEKGDKIIGVSVGTFNFNTQTAKRYYNGNASSGKPIKSNSFNVSVSPSIAVFVAKNFAVGPYVSSNFSHSNQGSNTEVNSFNIIFGPQARGYLISSEKGKAFIDMVLGIGFLSGKDRADDSGYPDQDYTFHAYGNLNASVGLGYEQFVTKNIGFLVEMGVGYTRMKLQYEDNYHNSGNEYNKINALTFQFLLGFQIHLTGKAQEVK